MKYKFDSGLHAGIWCIFLILLMAFFTGCASKTDVKPTGEAVDTSELKHILAISSFEDSESISVRIKGDRLLTFTSVKQPTPLAVLMYFPETMLESNVNRHQTISSPASSIDALELDVRGKTTKIEIVLEQDVPYQVSQEGEDLKISFQKQSPVNENEEASIPATDAKAGQPTLANSSVEKYTSTQQSASRPLKGVSADSTWVNRIDFVSEAAGKSTVIVGATQPVNYDIRKTDDKHLLLELFNAKIPNYRQRPLITNRFESAVDLITPFQVTTAKETTARFSIELREAVSYRVEQSDDLIQVHFEASSIPPKPLDEARLPEWKKVLSQTQEDITTPSEKKIDRERGTSTIISEEKYIGSTEKTYTGEKIALDFYETDIKNVFRILRQISGKNIAVDKDVTGKVTLAFEKPVPWDQVLDLILKMNQQ